MTIFGRIQLVDLIITWSVIIQCLSLVEITAFRLESKFAQDFFWKINFPIRALNFLTGHVIFKLRYNQIYQMKTLKEMEKRKREIKK